MKLVSLIGTYHGETGRANVTELHAIIERIQPEVIFLEAPAVPPGEKFLVDSLENAEGAAVIRYCYNHSAAVEAVDLATPDEHFFRSLKELFNELPRKSYDCHKLLAEHTESIYLDGFPYLNSDRHIRNQSEMHKATIEWLGQVKNKRFSEVYERFLKTNEQRDMAMLAKIRRFCLENEFERAVFLVGAAHRKSIMDKTMDMPETWNDEVSWDYSGKGAW